MKGTLLLVELAGHVGLLLWGTHMVGTGVQRGFGTALRRWLGRNLSSRWQAFLAGLGITALLQSSTATGLLATSFTATGVIDLTPALTVMLGANVGTALLTQALSFNMALVGPPLVLAGVLLFRWSDDGRAKNLGRVGIGLGLMLMALAGLLHTLGPVENTPLLRPVLGSLASDPVMAVLIAAALTWACHSSIAIVLLVASFAATHIVSPTGALALVLGANLGGALPAPIETSTNVARRLPLGNLLVRATGVLVALPFLPVITEAADTNAAERVAQETGLFLRMVRDLRRIHSHLASFAYPALNRQRTAAGLRVAVNGVSDAGAEYTPVASVPLPPSRPPDAEEDG